MTSDSVTCVAVTYSDLFGATQVRILAHDFISQVFNPVAFFALAEVNSNLITATTETSDYTGCVVLRGLRRDADTLFVTTRGTIELLAERARDSESLRIYHCLMEILQAKVDADLNALGLSRNKGILIIDDVKRAIRMRSVEKAITLLQTDCGYRLKHNEDFADLLCDLLQAAHSHGLDPTTILNIASQSWYKA